MWWICFGCFYVFLLPWHVMLLSRVWDSLHVVWPYLLAVTLPFLAFLFVAQVTCVCKATPIIRWRTTHGRGNKQTCTPVKRKAGPRISEQLRAKNVWDGMEGKGVVAWVVRLRLLNTFIHLSQVKRQNGTSE